MSNPIIQRELIGALRRPSAIAVQIVPAAALVALVLVRWPSDSMVDLAGTRAQQVFRVFAYSLVFTILMLVPAFSATTVVRERVQGTLALLLDSPLTPWSIYWGKLAGVMAIAMLPLSMSLPAVAGCYALGGFSLNQALMLYGILVLLALELTTIGLLVSTLSSSMDSALRISYGLVVTMAVILMGPYQIFQGQDWGTIGQAARWSRYMSPIPAVMELVHHQDLGRHGLLAPEGSIPRYVLLALGTIIGCSAYTLLSLRPTLLSRSRPPGVVTENRGTLQQVLRRLVFIMDPQRRTRLIGSFTNPVMIKEMRCRRFGRAHWMLRLVAVCAVASLGLTYTSTMGTLSWGAETIGGIMATLQFTLVGLLIPSLGAGLISTETESGGWAILQMTPLSTGVIIHGKLLSAGWTIFLILIATLPGYVVMVFIEPSLKQQISYVQITVMLAAVSTLVMSAAVSSLFSITARATVTSYALLLVVWGGTMLFWFGRETTFGFSTVEMALILNPLAAALCVVHAPGFTQYNLVPANWWVSCGTSAVCLLILFVQCWRLNRPR